MGRKKKEISFEEEQELRVNNSLKRLKDDYYYMPEPTYKYNIGDSVKIGSLKDCIIEQIIDNGKFYVINYTEIDNNYGNPIEIKNCKMVEPWFNLRKYNDNCNSFIENNDINIYYSNRTIDGLLTTAYHFGLDLSPDYQRGNVWELSDKVALIDSIFRNIDIGKFTFIKNSILEPIEVLDGKQRITAILEFYEDRFEYKGCKFSDLSRKDQRHFTSYNISWGESEGLTKEQKLRYFIKLNTTGKPIDKKHIEHVKEMLNECK